MNDVRVRVDRDDIADVVISRAATGNSLTAEVAKSLADGIMEAGSVARCVVLRTEGHIFCSGCDLGFLEGIVGEDREEFATSIYASFHAVERSIANCPVPVIARVQGAAVGAGCNIALACDLVVACDEAWFEESWVRFGGTTVLTGALHLVRGIGRHRALELLLGGRRVSADEAERIGMVNVAAPRNQLDSTVDTFARTIAKADRTAVAATKQLVRLPQQAEFDEALSHELRLQTAHLSGARARSGLPPPGSPRQRK